MDWSMLPNDIWCLIGSKLNTAADRVRFRAVSRCFESYLTFHQPIWLMLSEEIDEDEVFGEDMRFLLEEEPQPKPPRRGFIPVGEKHIHQLDLPEAHLKRCVSSTPGGWIVTVDYEGSVCLLNAFTRLQIDLPTQNTLENQGVFVNNRYGNDRKRTMMNGFLRKVVFSSSEDFINNKDWIAMGIFHINNFLVIYKPGDASWTELDRDFNKFDDIIYFRQQFHLVNHYGAVATYNIHSSAPLGFVTKPIHLELDVESRRRFYLVEWIGELLLVERLWLAEGEYIDYDNPYSHQKRKTFGFNLFQRDFTNNEWVELNNLGDYCLFLGLNTSASISISNYTTGSLQRNCIYFSPNRHHRLYFVVTDLPQLADDIGVYSLEDKSIQFLYHGISSPSCSPPIWIIPTLDHNH